MGERVPWSQNKFSREMARQVIKDIKRVRPPDADADQQYTVYLIPPAEGAEALDLEDKFALGRECRQFALAIERVKEGAWVVMAPPELADGTDDEVPL